jgi:hypothetical protein
MKMRSDFFRNWFYQKLAVLVLLLASAIPLTYSQTLGQALNATNLTWTTKWDQRGNGLPF